MIQIPPVNSAAYAPWRVFLNVAAYTMMFMFATVILLMACVMLFDGISTYGWLLRGEMRYAPHWQESDKLAMNAFAYAIRFDNDKYTVESDMYNAWLENGQEEPPTDTMDWVLMRDKHTLPHARRAADSLREWVQSDAATAALILRDSETPCTLPHDAAEMGQWAAMRVFVEKGFPVNQTDADGYSLLSLVLSNMESKPQQEVFSEAEWLLSKGAEVKVDLKLYEAVILADDGAATLEWLLAHGLPLDVCRKNKHSWLPLEQCVEEDVAMPVFERLVKEGRININDQRSSMTYLQLAAMAGKLSVLKMLLSLGAEVDLLPASEAQYAPEKRTPLALVLDMLAIQEAEEHGKEELQKLRLLFEHKAAPAPLPADWQCDALKQKTQEIFREFGYTPEQQPTDTNSDE